MDFYFPPPIPTPAPATSPPPPAPSPTPPPAPVPAIPPSISTRLEVFNGDGGLDIWSSRYDTFAPITTSLGIPSVHTGEVLDPTTPFYTFPGTPPESPPSLFGGKGRATDLKQALLGRQPKLFFAFEKKKVCFSSSPPLHFGVIGTPLPLVFFIVFFIEDNENLKHGG